MIHMTLTENHIDDYDITFEDDELEIFVNGYSVGYFDISDVRHTIDSIEVSLEPNNLCELINREDAIELYRILQERFELDAVDSIEPNDEPEWEPGADKFPGRTLTVPEGYGGCGLARVLSEFAPGDVVLDAVLRFTQRFASDEPMWARRLAFVALRAADVGDSTKHLSMLGRATVRRMIKQRGMV